MNQDLKNIEPTEIWSHFTDLNAVPRPSKKEEKIIQFMLDFGEKLNLETITDTVGNVIIKKPASRGMESNKTIVLQGHLDMVHNTSMEYAVILRISPTSFLFCSCL